MISQEQIKLYGWDDAGEINPVGMFAWDSGALMWIRQEPITGGGGGGAVTIADGADVAEGFTTDAAVITDAAGTVSGKLRGLVKWAYERMPVSLGQKTSANSFPVVISSDQSAVPVSQSGAWSVAATQSGVWSTGRTWTLASPGDSVAATQSGAWTVAATQSGAWTVAATQSGAWSISVTGTASVTTARTSLSAAAPAFATVGVASGSAVAANGARKGLVLSNTSNDLISFGIGAAAVLNSGITLYPGSSWTMNEYTFTTAEIFAIAGAAASNLSIQEFS